MPKLKHHVVWTPSGKNKAENEHRSVRGNYLRFDVTNVWLFIVIVFCVFAPCSGNIMGEHCDWSGNGLSVGVSQGRGVTPVYLRCSQGKVQWSFPRGALRVLLRLPSADKEFRGCLKVSSEFAGARIFLEGPRSLTPLFAVGDGGHNQLVRCFQSKAGQAALYVEAADVPADLKKQVAQFSYDLQAIPKGSSLSDLIADECRPCSSQEMAHAYCTSDLVTRGTIHTVDDLQEVEQARINVRLGRTLRHSTADVAAVNEVGSDVAVVPYLLPRHCEPQQGPGEFIFMGRKRLGDLTLTCVISLSQWAALSSTMNNDGSAHCVLRS